MKTTLIIISALLTTTSVFAGESCPPNSAMLGKFVRTVGSFQACTQTVAQDLTQQKDGSFKASSIAVNINDVKTGNNLMETHLKKKEYFDAATYPKAQVTGLVAKGGKFDAQLSLHGKTNKISGTYALKGPLVHAEFPIKLSEYGVEINYMGVGVDDEAQIEMNLPYKKQ